MLVVLSLHCVALSVKQRYMMAVNGLHDSCIDIPFLPIFWQRFAWG